MEERKTALDAWFKENSIDTQYRYLLMGGHGRGGHGGPGFGEMKDQQSSTSTTPSTSQ
jgi:hypothetical protein